ncbi:MAG: hypothetical protein ACO3WU_11050 [Ilumatobacteraceae bacterium]
MRVLSVAVVTAGVLVAACGGSDREDGLLVDRVDDALAAVEDVYGSPQAYVEVTATRELVSVIVAGGGPAEQLFWTVDGAVTDPVEVGSIDRPTFGADAVDFDPDRILARVREELPNSEIVDLAVTGDGAGGAIYDARLRSSHGGPLRVLLADAGRILGVQGE